MASNVGAARGSESTFKSGTENAAGSSGTEATATGGSAAGSAGAAVTTGASTGAGVGMTGRGVKTAASSVSSCGAGAAGAAGIAEVETMAGAVGMSEGAAGRGLATEDPVGKSGTAVRPGKSSSGTFKREHVASKLCRQSGHFKGVRSAVSLSGTSQTDPQ